MAWDEIGSWVVDDYQFLVPETFNSRLAVKVSGVSGLRPTWNFAGFFYQMVDLPVLGLARIDKKIATSIRDPIIFIPDQTNLPYLIRYQKADWIDSLQLTIYQDFMPLNSYAEVNIPNHNAATTISTVVPISAASVSFLAVNANRKRLIIANNSNQDLYIDFDATSAIVDHAIKIPKVSAGGQIFTYELEKYTGLVSGIWAAAGTGAALVKDMVA
ncbi:MAG: hypothetical protein HC930_02880 [Hydrococcus sp. SU_1_0]|nr:hypothetical protein [Hydrococcus sp. SU_1_0]